MNILLTESPGGLDNVAGKSGADELNKLLIIKVGTHDGTSPCD